MKKIVTIFLFLIVSAQLLGQTTQTIVINKPLKEFPDVYDLSTPLSTGVTTHYILIKGTDRWCSINVSMNNCKVDVFDGIKNKGV